MSGLFITFEGGEGSGKSTQLALVAEELRDAGFEVVTVREPGNTIVGEGVRAILLDPGSSGMDPRAELLLFEASRAQLMAQVIRPALAAGSIVLCDRHADSSTAYQGYARGLDIDLVEALNAAATFGVVPDRTLVFDINPALSIERATASGADRIEAEAIAFHQRVRAGYLKIAAAEPRRVHIVDASGGVEDVAKRARAALADLDGLEVLGGTA